MADFFPALLFFTTCLLLMAGYPVAFTLGGSALFFAGIGIIFGHFDPALLGTMSERLFGITTNATLMAVPLFVLIGASNRAVLL